MKKVKISFYYDLVLTKRGRAIEIKLYNIKYYVISKFFTAYKSALSRGLNNIGLFKSRIRYTS